ncbi:MAG: ABC transporter permease [Dehalococcoidales bacterium]|nr:MAG: ABC transporter permease [Dehalococcoidales bacterium]
MTKALQIALLQVRIYLQDRGDLGFSLLLPVVTFALMYFVFGGQTQFHATAHIVNEDPGGIYSEAFIEQLDALKELDIDLLSLDKADGKLERADLLMFVVIPEGFSDGLASGEPVELLFKQRGNGGQEQQIVAALVRSVADDISLGLQVQEQVIAALVDTDTTINQIETTVERLLADEQESPTVAVTEEAIGSSPDPVNQFLAGIITMYVLFAIILSARMLVEERHLGTLERLLTTRLSVGQLFAGKYIAGISRGFIQTVILMVLSYAVFQIFTPLSFMSSLLVALVYASAASALGLIIASVARTPDQATWMGVFFTMAMVMISGTFFPIEEGSVMEIISRFSVNTYANDAFRTLINEGGSLGDIGFEIGVLAGVIVVGLLLSRYLFKVMPGGR